MAGTKLSPERIRTPIQLLAVWFAVMVIVSGSFLAAASSMHSPAWVVGMLSIAAVAVVPIFLLCAILMQTRFRPQLQEDRYYLDWLKWQDSRVELIKREIETVRQSLDTTSDAISSRLGTIDRSIRAITQVASLTSTQAKVLAILTDAPKTYDELRRDLFELYGSETRAVIVRQLLTALVSLGLVTEQSNGTYKLTEDARRLATATDLVN